MIRVLDGLYLGDDDAARNRTRLRQHGVTHVVNCAIELPNYHEEDFLYLALRLYDPDPQFHRHLVRACAFIDRARRDNGGVLVHCYAAISRSPSVVLAYLCHQGLTLERAAATLGARVWTDPDRVHLDQLARLHGGPADEAGWDRLVDLLHGRQGDDAAAG
ncbi:MAG: dual specificity protein phosphatase [Gemmataceae bacterium]